MIEIKFRGKGLFGTSKNQWFFGGCYQTAGTTYIISHYSFIDVKPETVGQFTGFKDIDGKEIYEGDIIKNTEHPKLVYTVDMLDDGSWSGVLIDDEDEDSFLSWLLEHAPFKVIGNIHDNPELLGSDKSDNC